MSGGFIVINKPAGQTSAKIVAGVKRRLQANRVGHAGTLDPMATGILVCAVDQATRLISFVEAGQKTYSGEILLGTVTSTDDIEGEVLKTSSDLPDVGQVLAACKEFLGKIEQVPPQISAIKVNGERAYKLSRAGENVELKARSVEVFKFDVECELPKIRFTLECSKGTYVRSIARDLGELLGCGACLASLCREASVPFNMSQAVNLEEVNQDAIRPWPEMVPHLKRVFFPRKVVEALLQGQQSVLETFGGCVQEHAHLLYGVDDTQQLIGLLTRNEQGRWTVAANLEELNAKILVQQMEETCQRL